MKYIPCFLTYVGSLGVNWKLGYELEVSQKNLECVAITFIQWLRELLVKWRLSGRKSTQLVTMLNKGHLTDARGVSGPEGPQETGKGRLA